MLRTNLSFLSFIESMYGDMPRKEDLILKTFSKGSMLLEQGQRVNKVFIVREGITKCYFSEENGKNYILEFLTAGEILGEIEALRSIPCLCNVSALTPVQAYAMNVPFLKPYWKRTWHGTACCWTNLRKELSIPAAVLQHNNYILPRMV